MKRKIAIYARQSIDKGDLSYSIEQQTEECKRRANSDNCIEYADKGFSGKNTKRPDLERLIEDIKSGIIEKVVVYKLDRISRNICDFYSLYEIMKANNCTFMSATEPFDTSCFGGEAMMGILAVFSQLERSNIQKRVKDNYYYRIANIGSWAGGPAPYGFKNGRNEEDKPTLIPIPEEIEAVRFIFNKYTKGHNMSLSKLARLLHEEGYCSRKRLSFDNVSLARILRNTIYVQADNNLYNYFKSKRIHFENPDESLWDGSRSCHIVGKKHNSNYHSYTDLSEQSIYLTNVKGFIPSLTFIEAQEKLKENKQLAGAKKDGTVLQELSGKIKCRKCGYAIKSYHKAKDGRPYLSCYGKTTLKSCDCTFRKVNFYKLQEKVGEQIQKEINNMGARYSQIIGAYNDLLNEIKALEDENKELLSMHLRSQKLENNAGKELSEKLLLEMAERERRIAELRVEVEMAYFNIHKLPLTIGVDKVGFDTLKTTPIIYSELDEDTKKEVVNLLINKIYLHPNGDIDIEWWI